MRGEDMKGIRLLLLAAIVSLLASALWVKSYLMPSRITYHRKGKFMVFVDDWKGRLFIDFSDSTYMQGSVRTEYGNALGWSDTTWLSNYGTGPESWFLRFPNRGRWTGISFLVPIWSAWIVSVALLITAWMR